MKHTKSKRSRGLVTTRIVYGDRRRPHDRAQELKVLGATKKVDRVVFSEWCWGTTPLSTATYRSCIDRLFRHWPNHCTLCRVRPIGSRLPEGRPLPLRDGVERRSHPPQLLEGKGCA